MSSCGEARGNDNVPGFITARAIGPVPSEIDSEFIIGGIIERGKRTLFHANEGTGKTTLAMMFAGQLATPDELLRQKFIDKSRPGRTLFIATERFGPVKRRMWAYLLKHKPEAVEHFLENVDFVYASQFERETGVPFRLDSTAWRDRFLVGLRRMVEDAGSPYDLIINDGLAMSLFGAVDSAEVAIAANVNIERIMEETRVGWLDLHHNNKAGVFHGSKFHSNLPGYRFEILGASNESTHLVVCRKSDSAEYGPCFSYKIESVFLNGENPPGFAAVSKFKAITHDDVKNAQRNDQIEKIKQYVADNGGKISRQEFKKFAVEELGYSESSSAGLLGKTKLKPQIEAAGIKVNRVGLSFDATTT
ncbi:MAG: hypothetical protein DHS20C05_03570 [Hyphococcus sp.]|nr:MAG: hypothetical protein DHS20C05_03570 [Marinicaulis sp.]